jgi:hypothetical protein
MTAQKHQVFWPVSEWEALEAQRRARDAARLPRGFRSEARRRIAADYGISPRTVERWANYKIRTVRCAGWSALFVVGQRRPSQVTPWEKVA